MFERRPEHVHFKRFGRVCGRVSLYFKTRSSVGRIDGVASLCELPSIRGPIHQRKILVGVGRIAAIRSMHVSIRDYENGDSLLDLSTVASDGLTLDTDCYGHNVR